MKVDHGRGMSIVDDAILSIVLWTVGIILLCLFIVIPSFLYVAAKESLKRGRKDNSRKHNDL